ncbi:MAG: hypothetical protein ABR598_07000 [Candidatus Dormibacteria bacterium]
MLYEDDLNGDTNLGDPKPAFDGGGLAELFATLSIPVPALSSFAISLTVLPPGTHTLTAVFTPTNPTAYQPLTSLPITVTINQRHGIRVAAPAK